MLDVPVSHFFNEMPPEAAASEILELVRAFRKIRSNWMRQYILSLIQKLVFHAGPQPQPYVGPRQGPLRKAAGQDQQSQAPVPKESKGK